MAVQQALTKQQKFKRGVWAVAVAAVIFVGSLTGAQLKQDKQKEEVHAALNPKKSSFVRPMLTATSRLSRSLEERQSHNKLLYWSRKRSICCIRKLAWSARWKFLRNG